MAASHRSLSLWYHQLAQQLDAGRTLAEALRMSAGVGVATRTLDAMAGAVEGGGTVDDALRAAGDALPYGDVLALSAAAEAGRMPRTLQNLSSRHEQIGAAQIRLIMACAYPAALLHLGCLLFPLAGMIDWEKGFRWDVSVYLHRVGVSILPWWALGAVVAWLSWRGSPLLRTIGLRLPAVGRYLREQALADFAFALGNFLEAGVPIGQAWPAAGLITRSRELQSAATAIEAAIARGQRPGAHLAAQRVFPAAFVALYRSGEMAGQLESNLLQLAGQHQAAANRALTVTTFLYPAVAFGAMAAMVVYQAVTIYGGYLKMLGKLAE